MNTGLEEDLRSRLQRHGATLPTPPLEQRVEGRVRAFRRRRRVGLAVGLAGLVALPVTIGWSVPHLATTHPQVAATPTVASALPADLDLLPTGPEPGVGYVAGPWWYQPNDDVPGSVHTTPVGATGAAPHALVGYRGGLFAQRTGPTGEVDRYAIGDGPVRAIPAHPGLTVQPGASAGPDGAVLIAEDRGVLLLERSGRWSRSERFGDDIRAEFELPLASRRSLWTSVRGADAGVSRLSSLADEHPDTFPQWSRVLTSSPVADLVVVADRGRCQDLVDGSTGTSRWHTCAWSMRQISPDGRYALATSADPFRAAVLDLASRTVAYELPSSYDPDIAKVQFAPDGNLNLVLSRDREPSEAIVTCGSTGSCWRATPWLDDSIAFVEPNN